MLERLGEGGFGVVWRAEQTEPVRREVAVKVIKPGMDSASVLARFEAERQALAVMDHPCIAKVFDGGATDRGLSYFVMELIRGEPITAFCDRHRLGITERVELLIGVCEAVQHAHTKGVIHRDIKPSNILVAYDAHGRARPKVIDFGVAKALNQRLSEQTIFTERGQLIGTPEYMSPEQAEMSGLDIDTRSDVYSLGVVLYELLTGALPFDSATLRSAGFAEIQRIIREVDPPRPSTRLGSAAGADGATSSRAVTARASDLHALKTTLRRDLDWVVMRCIEKDRARRYDMAGDVADELRRFLRHEPVLAGPPSPWYRLRKLARRHRTAVLVGAMVMVLLLAGLAGTGYGLLRAEHRASEAETARRELQKVVAFQAAQLSDLDAARMGERLRGEILRAAGPDAERLAEALGRVNFTDIALGSLEEQIFDRALGAIDSGFASEPLVRARLLQTTAETLRAVGLLGRAVEPQAEALRLRRELLGDRHPDTLRSVVEAGRLSAARGRLEEAEPLLREGLDGLRHAAGPDDPATLDALNSMGLFHKAMGRFAEAESCYREALGGCRRALGETHRDTLSTLNNLGALLQEMGQSDEAERCYREALEARRRTLGPDDPDTLVSLSNMGSFLLSTGRAEEAEPMFAEALAGARKHFGDEHSETIISLSTMGGVLWTLGRAAEAEPYWTEALDTASRVLGPDHPLTLDSANNVGLLRHDQGRPKEAEALFRRTLSGRRRVLGDDHPKTLQALRNLAATLANLGRLGEAEPLLLENERRTRAACGDDDDRTIAAVRLLVRHFGRRAEAEPGGGFDAQAALWRARLPGVGG